MTIEEIAKRLDDCANGKCDGCRHYGQRIDICQSAIIKDMGAECRKLAEQMGDDGK